MTKRTFNARLSFLALSVLASMAMAPAIGHAAGEAPAAAAAPAATTPAPAAEKHHQRHSRMTPEQRAEKHAQHLQKMKAALKITASQEPAWDAFAQTMGHQHEGMKDHRANMEKMANMTTLQRVDHMREMRQAHAAKADQRDEAIKKLYAALTPEQQKVMDNQFKEHMKKGMRSHHGKGHFGDAAK